MSAKPLILVVDDNDTNRMVACAMLARLGFATATAVDGIEAVRAVMATSHAAILMDFMMPRMDGGHATRAIRGHEIRSLQPRTPIIGLSAMASDEDRDAALAGGMDVYLTKPLKSEELRKALEKCGVLLPGSPATPAETAAAPAPTTLPTMDQAESKQLLELPDRLALTFWKEFARDIPKRITEINTALSGSDLAAAQRLVHSLRGYTATLAMPALAHGLLACELALKHGDPAWRTAWDQVPVLAEAARLAALKMVAKHS